jgi:hypothetical protein
VRGIGPSADQLVEEGPVIVQDLQVVTFWLLEHQVLSLQSKFPTILPETDLSHREKIAPS